MKIFVNGMEHVIPFDFLGSFFHKKSQVSYRELVGMWKLHHNPSVVYHKGPASNPEGILLPGQSIEVTEGMVFDIMVTGAA